MTRRRTRGVTLIEIMISLALILTGMLVLFRVLSTSISGSSFSSRAAQAHMRAATIMEAIRQAPSAALTCLVATAPANWATCETTCLANQTAGAAAKISSCVFTTGTPATPSGFANIGGPTTNYGGVQVNNEMYDRQGELYFLSTAVAAPTAPTAPANWGSTYVRQVGDGLRTFEIAVTVGWTDDNLQPGATVAATHGVTLVSGVFQ